MSSACVTAAFVDQLGQRPSRSVASVSSVQPRSRAISTWRSVGASTMIRASSSFVAGLAISAAGMLQPPAAPAPRAAASAAAIAFPPMPVLPSAALMKFPP